MTELKADIGVFGGSGFYSLIEGLKEIKLETPYGPPSDTIALGTVAERKVAFLPRHGKNHQYPPHMIPYRANIHAMKQLGVTRIIGPNCVGSLQKEIKPGDFVVCDQFVDRTTGRKDTFYDGPIATHISSAEPYCETMRKLAVRIGREQGITMHDGGTTVCVQGPRFSSRAESLWFTRMGWHVVNMTQYPENILSLEQEICYVNIALITDYDVGIVAEGGAEPVNADEVVRVLNENNERVRNLILEMIKRIPDTRDCPCATALKYARFG
ncbi:MAG: S-methyl-5'-thioadenosine phosphorylase [Armatimonadetes bacterium]|nr:S-methyl-5'-thioadenosine phosphorylase [Armatimonadota bacterium]